MTTQVTTPEGVRQATSPRPPRRRPSGRDAIQWKGYLYVLPALVVFIVFIGIPLAQTAWYSLWDWNGLTTATWNGLANYAAIFTDSTLIASFAHTGILIVFYAIIPVVLALILTVVMSRANRMRGVAFFRAMLFLPQVVPTVVVATIWVSIYSPEGLLNQVIGVLGVNDPQTAWLGTVSTALPAVGMIGTWLGIGLCIVLFVSGVASIPRELYESARLDGAGIVREFFTVTLPGLRGHIAVALTLTATTALKSFDIVYVTTRGGPGTATTVPAYEIYNRAFGTNQVGSAAAIAVVLTAFILVITVAISKIQPKEAAE
jgi:raffinose/stachyose/melibiose transport system permease protein